MQLFWIKWLTCMCVSTDNNKANMTVITIGTDYDYPLPEINFPPFCPYSRAQPVFQIYKLAFKVTAHKVSSEGEEKHNQDSKKFMGSTPHEWIQCWSVDNFQFIKEAQILEPFLTMELFGHMGWPLLPLFSIDFSGAAWNVMGFIKKTMQLTSEVHQRFFSCWTSLIQRDYSLRRKPIQLNISNLLVPSIYNDSKNFNWVSIVSLLNKWYAVWKNPLKYCWSNQFWQCSFNEHALFIYHIMYSLSDAVRLRHNGMSHSNCSTKFYFLKFSWPLLLLMSLNVMFILAETQKLSLSTSFIYCKSQEILIIFIYILEIKKYS